MTRVRYSPEGIRVFCTKRIHGFPPDNPERAGTILRHITLEHVEVLWDDRRSRQIFHRDYLETFKDSAAPTSPGRTADNAEGCSAASPRGRP